MSSKLNAKSEFHQMILSPESRKLNIPYPLRPYYFNSLLFGISCALEMFQTRMPQVLENCENVASFLDDVLMWGTDEPSHNRNLDQVLQKIAEAKMILNQEECVFRICSIKFLGNIKEKYEICVDQKQSSLLTLHSRKKSSNRY